MDASTARALIALNNRFYADHAASFSATRKNPWPGWERVLAETRNAGVANTATRPLRVLDLACGTMRFGAFLSERAGAGTEAPALRLELHGVDACATLPQQLPDNVRTAFHRVDILDELLAGRDPVAGIPPCDLVVCFGFMHHVPGAELRRAVLNALVDATAPGGVVALSFWRFMDDERLARKAAEVEGRATTALRGIDLQALDPGDHLLGWQEDQVAFRYCHHVDEGEVDALATSVGDRAHEIARFSADGASGALNRYLVLQRT